MTDSYTDGPWIQIRSDDVRSVPLLPSMPVSTVATESGILIANVHEPFVCCVGTCVSNACLIAAAPDLLSVLEEIMDGVDNGEVPGFDLWSNAKAAIAKAKGVQTTDTPPETVKLWHTEWK